MPLRRQFLYYQLLKFSGHGTQFGDVLDQAVDRLCGAPGNRLARVPLRIQLDALLQVSQEVDVLQVPEVAQLCLEVKQAILREGSTGVTVLFMGRALEAAGVSFAIDEFTERYRTCLESRLYRTQGLEHLLNQYGDQVISGISECIDTFGSLFTTRALELDGFLHGLVWLKRTHVDAYRIFLKHRRAAQYKRPKVLRRGKTMSLSLDDQDVEEEDVAVVKLIPGRRAFSVDVQAGLETLALAVAARDAFGCAAAKKGPDPAMVAVD